MLTSQKVWGMIVLALQAGKQQHHVLFFVGRFSAA